MLKSKLTFIVLSAGLFLLCGCIGSFISKGYQGNLEINIRTPPSLEASNTRIYVDDIFVGNVSERLPVLHLRRGKRVIRAELEGAEFYAETIEIIGDPNHQVLNIVLKPK